MLVRYLGEATKSAVVYMDLKLKVEIEKKKFLTCRNKNDT